MTYHVLVADASPRAEPWSVRRTHDEFRALLGELGGPLAPDVAALDELTAQGEGALDPRRLLSSRHLRRRVALLNALLQRVVRDDGLRASAPFRAFVRPVPLKDDDADARRDGPVAASPRTAPRASTAGQLLPRWVAPLLPDPRAAAVGGLLLCGLVSRACRRRAELGESVWAGARTRREDVRLG